MAEDLIILDDLHISAPELDPEAITATPRGEYSFLPLYKKTGAGNDRFWMIRCHPDGRLFMSYGHVGGVPQEESYEITTNLSGRDLSEQIFLEARARYRDKIRAGYRSTHSGAIQPPPLGEPMLATTWKPGKENLVAWPVWADIKLDGIRNRVRYDPINPDKILMRTRGGKTLPFLDMFRFFTRIFLNLLPHGYEIDGEMYRQEVGYNWIQSVCTRTVNPHPEEYKLQYWIFDLNDGGKCPTEERKALLKATFTEYKQYLQEHWNDVKVEYIRQYNYSRSIEKSEAPMKIKKLERVFHSMKISAYNSYKKELIDAIEYDTLLMEYDDKFKEECDAIMAIDKKYDALIATLDAGYNSELDPLIFVEGEPCFSGQDLEEFANKYESDGYEGVVFRRLLSSEGPNGRKFTLYRPDRSVNLYKYKNFIDEEGTIVGYTHAYERGIKVVMWAILDMRGNIFPVRPRGTLESRHEYLLDAESEFTDLSNAYFPFTTSGPQLREEFVIKIVEHFRKYVNGRSNLNVVKIIDWEWFSSCGLRYNGNLIGKRYTIRYQGLSEDLVPRFPVGIDFRRA